MKITKIKILPVVLAGLFLTLHSCKTKKAAITSTPVPVVEPKKEAEKTESPSTAVAEAKQSENVNSEAASEPDLNFKNIQFEFNSAVLKTFSYPVLDKIASDMKKTSTVKFVINGHSSAEGTPEHNNSLSEDRANAVKSYLVNAGVDVNSLNTMGYGESKPIASNQNEEGRALNRRVEIKRVN
ncbi:OmpA family protein [Desertivirga xinjiangensis]|uniref:OmpA family protein n=1 Tax=Desertivirga xinjiangensis TaxID=539206 RepID=UPI002109AA82|nr:OmpA family protein [Pedobacter xinjiangensis]